MPGINPRLFRLSALLLSVALAACGGGGEKKTTNATSAPAATQAAATAASTAAVSAATATPAQASRSFTDDTGKTLTIAQPPKRVVALSPSMVELLYAVEAPPVARVSSANFPDAARSLPAVGSSYQVSIEQVAAQQPDLILADQQIQSPQVIAELQKIAPVFAIRVLSFDDVPKALRTTGRIMGKTEQGEKAAKGIEDKLAAVQAKLPQQRPTVFIMIGDANAFFAAKPNAFVGDVVAKLGAKNVVPAGPDTSQFPGFTSYSLEQLAQLDPDVILVLTAGPPNVPRLSQVLASNPAWAGLRAVKSGRVREIDPVTLVQSAGPQVTKDIDELAAILYPGVFSADYR
jgi:iron complex transport system substrate-binding protein